jgi:hypothetical protein
MRGGGGCLAFAVASDATPVLTVGNRTFWQLPCLDAQPALQKERDPSCCDSPLPFHRNAAVKLGLHWPQLGHMRAMGN